ncbi:hypothetical protein ACIBQX_45495 [Nonomuraea sp. NPDC049714]|uniref:hypothetical protein n=1 Tax=Nonomuraea sp. NPDC049714 TaxID=3364357 RepID=UPI00378FF1B5
MSGWEIVLGVVAGLVVNEMTEMSPWLARRLVTWSAHHRYEDPERAAYLGCGALGLFTAGLWATFGPYSLVLLLAPSMVIPLVHRTPRRVGSGG